MFSIVEHTIKPSHKSFREGPQGFITIEINSQERIESISYYYKSMEETQTALCCAQFKTILFYINR